MGLGVPLVCWQKMLKEFSALSANEGWKTLFYRLWKPGNILNPDQARGTQINSLCFEHFTVNKNNLWPGFRLITGLNMRLSTAFPKYFFQSIVPLNYCRTIILSRLMIKRFSLLQLQQCQKAPELPMQARALKKREREDFRTRENWKMEDNTVQKRFPR